MSRLTKRGQDKLTRLIETLIDEVAQGNTWHAKVYVDWIETIVLENERKASTRERAGLPSVHTQEGQ